MRIAKIAGLILLFAFFAFQHYPESAVYIRLNLVGYLPSDFKEAIIFSTNPILESGVIINVDTDQEVMQLSLQPLQVSWKPFDFYYAADFSRLQQPGRYVIRIGDTFSDPFVVHDTSYQMLPDAILSFMRQQRCGYNPFLDTVCHRMDGRTFYGPWPDSTYVDVHGGWHDAGDQLKYLLTASNATARLLLTYELAPNQFADRVNALGQSFPNGVPDVLDEARWGLDWLFRLHPEPNVLIHQVGDDRDHIGWKWPQQDRSDYGWGPGSYRVAYVATGHPQGLGHYLSEATGIANLAGRYAAAMAMAYRIWLAHGDTAFALRCLNAAEEVYALGKAHEGYQQGNSYGAPYRYTERTWADDMEWGAAELFKATHNPYYLQDAMQYARQIGATSWMLQDTMAHYEYYPFVNVGHFALYPLVDVAFQESLATFYRMGLEAIQKRARNNPFGIGVPFLWCSNNLVSAVITQGLLYEQMTGDLQYHQLIIRHRDWLLGRNPWGTSFFTGVPHGGEYPEDIHTSIWVLTQRVVSGGLVDGPVSIHVYRNLKGLSLVDPDEFAAVQPALVVYHDDRGDYATNEPTMDGTADALYWLVYWASK